MMRSWLRIAVSFLILCASFLLFEVQNVWPFNEHIVSNLRIAFTFFTIAAFVCVIAKKGGLAFACLMAGFVSTSLFSNAEISFYFVLLAIILALSLWLVSGFKSA
ncbi:hypothetical protein SAMN02745824_3355 [Parasphingorhabdus marina DSM 22363]|uniref:Uncharacterized protein n=1 Tax=Parasphingorhabdus marina DSM 22363 TaxID=1123272 RepID=A0A1N6HLR1_9SPHN|nr:hypothetical protein SAMN02745824_3355 [Parasphingorhabdus marina DSM 22363]